MKTSLAGFACLAWLIILSLSQRGDAQFLDDSCKTSRPSQNGAWTVAVRNETKFLCAGSLIHPQFVLTAAQCISGQRYLFVMLGSSQLDSAPRASVKQATIHRLYSRETGLNDIGLVMLSQRVDTTDQVRPICILRNPMEQDSAIRIKNLKTFGWRLGTSHKIINNRAEFNILRFNRIYCEHSQESSYFCGGPSLEGTCGGDIGGPVSTYVTLEDQEAYPVQYGMATFGQNRCDGARLYIDVTSYADWIESYIRANENPKVRENPKTQPPQSPATEEMRLLYNDCGDIYLTANIYGPDFMAKGVMITHRFVLTTATNLHKDVSNLRVGVEGIKNFQELEIESVYMPQDVDGNDGIALLRLSSEIFHNNIMKPICIVKRPTVEQSQPLLTILDINRRETDFDHTFKLALPIEDQICSTNFWIQLQQNDICIQFPRKNRQVFGIRGNVVSQSLSIPGQNARIHALFGIVKFASGGLNIVTDVTSHMDWIESVVQEN